MVKKIIKVVMDGITDTNMLIDYAEDCEDYSDWFMSNARSRFQTLESNYNDLKEIFDLKNKIASGDETAELFDTYVSEQIYAIRKRLI